MTDKTITAFRRYSKICGKGTVPYIHLVKRLSGSFRDEKTAIAVLCVRDMFDNLYATGNEETAKAVKAIYCFPTKQYFRKNDITFRIRSFAMSHNMDERTVYRKLQNAKELYLKLLENKLTAEENK